MKRILMITMVVLSVTVRADDWPQWMGPQRDGIWRETGVIDAMPAAGLTVKWRAPVARGYSGPAVAGGRVFLMDYVRRSGETKNNSFVKDEVGGRERVLCLDAATGALLWKHEYPRPYKIAYSAGPRCTPTVDGDKVYALGAEGNLWCLAAATGRVIWSKDFTKDYGAKTPMWGYSSHPLVDGDTLFCVVGSKEGVAVALDKNTGKERWRALPAAEPGYCPPSLIEHNGKRQLLIWHGESINSVVPATGKLNWSVPLKPSYGMAIAAPRQSGSLLFASSFKDVGALLKLNDTGAEMVWQGNRSNALYSGTATPFVEGDVVYGCDADTGALTCARLSDGKRLWQTTAPTTGEGKKGRYGTVFLVKHEDRFFLFNEQGDLLIAKLSPKGYEELGRFHVLEPTNTSFGRSVVWSHPAFAQQCLFARNDRELVCVDLRQPSVAATKPGGFQAIFNGKDLTGWDGPPGAWRVEDGALTWESTPENPLKDWPYLVWKGGEPENFELHIDFKLSAEANSGVNFRSELSGRWYVKGDQADMNGNGWLVGSIYAPRGFPKNLMSQRGEKSVISAAGKREAVPFGGGHGPLGKAYRKGEWNSMRLVCRGAEIVIYVNDVLMTELQDNDPRAPKKGVIALQMHQGPPMKIQFKNILLKQLPAPRPPASSAAQQEIDLLASRNLADWDFFLVDPKLRKEDVWSFTDAGVLVCKGKPLGWLATKKNYRNFRLAVEWRWPGKPSNSGVQFRITGEPQGLPCCIEAQLQSGDAGDIYGLQGKRIAGAPLWHRETSWGGEVRIVKKKLAAENPPGQWNRYVITALDDNIILKINGQEVNRATGADTAPGKIGFQSEGDVIEFRNVKLQPLDQTPIPSSQTEHTRKNQQ